MPINLASPGIKVREVDLTIGRVDPSSEKVGGLVAPFAQGPVDLPTVVGSEKDLLDNFGKRRKKSFSKSLMKIRILYTPPMVGTISPHVRQMLYPRPLQLVVCAIWRGDSQAVIKHRQIVHPDLEL